MSQQKEYFAFISYQRKDEEWADRLRNKLEHYRLPSSVRKHDASLPKEIRPIFRDALELAGGVLAKEIETALQNSKFLIVICSPNSAKAPWVNKEIQTFIDLGREDRIIPFIIDGTPFSDNEETECFPPALRTLKGEKELLGININELSRDAAAIKVVARMFGLKFDTLWQRYEREKKRKRWMIIGSVALLAIVAFVVAGFFMNLSRTISQQNFSLLKAAERMKADSILQAQHIKRITEDSISLAQQNDSIHWQYMLIEQQKDEIAMERDNAKSANYAMQVNLSRILAKEASRLVDEGDSYLARLLALEALPPNRPYTIDAESALRKCFQTNNAILRGHTDKVKSAVFSPNGRIIASISYDNTIRIWDAETGRCRRILDRYASYVNSVAFSPDGKKIVSASGDKTIRIWDVGSGHCLQIMNGHKSIVNSASFSFDGKRIVSASNDETICIWDVGIGRCIQTLKGHTSIINSAVFSPDGKQVVSASLDSTIRIWDVKSGLSLRTIKHDYNVSSAAYSPSGSRIVSVSLSTIRIWDAITCRCDKSFEAPKSEWFHSAVFSPNGLNIVTSISNNSVQILDIISGECVQHFTGFTRRVNTVAFSPDGNRIIIASDDRTIRLRDLNTKLCMKGLDESNRQVCSAFSLDGKRILSISDDGTIRNWDVKDRCLIRTLKGNVRRIVSSAAFSPDGRRIVLAYNDRTVCIWNALTGKLQHTLEGHTDNVSSAVFSPDGKKIVSASFDKTIRIWDANSGHCIKIIKEHNLVNTAAFSPDGKKIISASYDHTIRIWDTKSGFCLQSMKGHTSVVNIAVFSPDGKRIVSASVDKTICIWDAENGKCLHTLDVFAKSLSFSPDGKRIVSASVDKKLHIWDVESGFLIQTLDTHTIIKSITFSPKDDKTIILTEIDGVLNILDFLSLKELVEETCVRFKNRQLSHEERRKYYLE